MMNSMGLRRSILAVLVFVLGSTAFGQARIANQPAEPLLRNLPPGMTVVSSSEIPAANRESIGNKLGGKIARLTNSTIRVQGRPIQVNVIVAADDASADALWGSLNRIKRPPFLVRRSREIIEYVANDDSLARKTTWELGIEPKPKAVRYRVTAELATVDKPDDMAANPLFQACIDQSLRSTPANAAKIAELAAKFTFGKSLALRNSDQGGETKVKFEPAPLASRDAGSKTVHEFGELPVRHGVPYAKAIIETTVMGADFTSTSASKAPDAALTSATSRWPADDPKIRELATSITAGKADDEAKVAAILVWLRPGQNIRYEGQTGSRWGTAKVHDQKFGHCWDFSDLFVTLARSAGVPARQVAGWLYGTSGHVWAEWYDPRRGWVPVDPTGGGALPCGIYHIAYFTTDDGEMPIVYVAMPKIEIIETR